MVQVDFQNSSISFNVLNPNFIEGETGEEELVMHSSEIPIEFKHG